MKREQEYDMDEQMSSEQAREAGFPSAGGAAFIPRARSQEPFAAIGKAMTNLAASNKAASYQFHIVLIFLHRRSQNTCEI